MEDVMCVSKMQIVEEKRTKHVDLFAHMIQRQSKLNVGKFQDVHQLKNVFKKHLEVAISSAWI